MLEIESVNVNEYESSAEVFKNSRLMTVGIAAVPSAVVPVKIGSGGGQYSAAEAAFDCYTFNTFDDILPIEIFIV